MGLFDIFFKSSSKPEVKIRDHFVKLKRLEKELKISLEFAEIDVNAFSTNKENGKVVPFNYSSLAMDCIDEISIRYSMGEDIQKLQDLYLQSLDNFISGFEQESPCYGEVFDRVSLGLLLDIPQDAIDKLVDYVSRMDTLVKRRATWKPDKLLWYMLNARIPDKDKKHELPEVVFDPVYRRLYKITEMPEEKRKNALVAYLGKWYGLSRMEPWYNTHLQSWGYAGYWAWAVGAVAKIMHIDDSELKDNPYYPYDMVHWEHC